MKRSPRPADAFTLVEVTLAIGIAAFSLLAVFGLLPVGIATNQAALEQTGANDILSSVVSDLRSTPPTTPRGLAAASKQFGVQIPANPVTAANTATVYMSTGGAPSTTLLPSSHFLVVVTFVPNGTASRAPTLAKLTVSWPAVAGAGRSIGSVEQFLVLDRN